MHKQKPAQENETNKILSDFEIKTDRLISDRRSDLEIIKKRKEKEKLNLLFSGSQSENQGIQKKKYLNLATEIRKLWNVRMKVKPTAIGAVVTVPKGLERWVKKFEIGRRIETI